MNKGTVKWFNKKYNWMEDIRKNDGREKNSLLNEKIRV